MKNVTLWNSQLVMLQSVLKDHEEVNTALALIQSPNRITNQDYLALNELIRVLLPFKEPMQQIEGENIVTSSSICPVVIGLIKAMKQLKNANLIHCKKLATALHDSVLKRLLPFLNCMDNRLASLLHPRFKQKWIENDDEKEEALRVLQMHVTSRLGPFQEDCSSSSSTDDDNGSLAKKPKLFDFIAEGSKKKTPKNSGREIEIYFAEDILHFDEDPLTFWKKKSEELPTLAVLAKEFLGLTATSTPAERLLSIAGNFYTAKKNLLGTDTFHSLMFIKCNSNIYDKK